MTRRRLWIAWLPDGKRLQLRDGPFNLIIQAFGRPGDIAKAYDAAIEQMRRLAVEFSALHAGAVPALSATSIERMHAAVVPFAQAHFMPPMFVLAGAAADSVLAAMREGAQLDRAYVNHEGGVAFHLAEGQRISATAMERAGQFDLPPKIVLESAAAARGIAMAGWAGSYPCLGIADTVFVSADSAARAEAAAQVIANATDLPGHPAIRRSVANQLNLGRDFGEREVTVGVAPLQKPEKIKALAAGTALASGLQARGLVEDIAICVQGELSLLCNKPWAKALLLDNQARGPAGT